MEVVDDQYWLSYGKKVIDGMDMVGSENFARLEKFLLWLWAAYTAVFALTATLFQFDVSVFWLWVMASPIVTLIITYWVCHWVQRPVVGQFDPESPTEIRDYFNILSNRKVIRINVLGLCLLVASLSVAAALVTYKFAREKKNGVTIERKGNDYYVSGRFDKDQFVEINAVAPDSTGAVRTIWKGSAKSFDKLLSYHFIDTSKSKAVEVMVIHQESDSAPAYGFRRRFK